MFWAAGGGYLDFQEPPPLVGIPLPWQELPVTMRVGVLSSPTVFLLTLGMVGCKAAIEAPPPGPVAVVQALLIAGDSQQVAWVEWRVPADSSFGPEVRPVDPSLVQVSLVLPNGGSVPFTPSPGIPGRFQAGASVVPGAHYRLSGAIEGVGLAAETTVPDTIAVRVPAQDTVDGGSCVATFLYCNLPYSWSAVGASAYFYFQSTNDTSQVRIFGSTHDPTGILRLVQDTGTERLTVLAVEENAASFLIVTTPKSSVSGIFGLFGAATRVERWIVWP